MLAWLIVGRHGLTKVLQVCASFFFSHPGAPPVARSVEKVISRIWHATSSPECEVSSRLQVLCHPLVLIRWMVVV